MKKIIITLLSVLVLLGACTKIEERGFDSMTNVIAFNANNGAATKAIVEGTTMVDNFGVYGYVVPGTYSTNGGYLMKNAEYEETGDAANGKSYYWPISDNNEGIDFIFTAYSQFVNEPVWENDTLKVNVPAISQSLINNPADFNDILWAQTKVNHHQNGNVSYEHEKVNLNFKHALSWIQFTGTVANNPSVKWIKVKSVKFEQWQEGQEETLANPGQEYIAAYNETTDTWVNLKRSYSAVGSATKLRVKTGDTWGSYTNASPLPDALVAEIKSYYTVDNGTAGDYDLHMGNSVWPSATIKQLRVVKEIPAAYDLAVEMSGGEIMHFFNGWKYLQDNGYDIQPATSGGKPDVWNYVLIDAFVNGAAYTVVGLNCWDSNAVPQHTIVEHPEQPYIAPTEYQPAIPEGYISYGIYSGGVLGIPTNAEYTTEPIAVYGAEKVEDLNYCAQEITIETNDSKVLGNSLIIPQAVPEYVTVVFDICIENTTGDEVIITDRKVTRKINAGNDLNDLQYVASWLSSNRYIYNFTFDGEKINFNILVQNWDENSTTYQVLDYTN